MAVALKTGNEHVINCRRIAAEMAVVFAVATVFAICIWAENMTAGIVFAVCLVGVGICATKEWLAPRRIKSVSVSPAGIQIQYRKASELIAYDECKQIEHYKHGPLTERILLRTKGRIIIEIPYYLSDFQGMCRSIYRELSAKNLEHVADRWFQLEFGEGRQKTEDESETGELTGSRFPANFALIWTLMAVQAVAAAALIVLLWSGAGTGLKIAGTVAILICEFLAVVVVTSPKLTREVFILAGGITARYKEKSFEIPAKGCEKVIYSRPWPMPRRVYVFADNGYYVLLPWYIRNFRGMCRCIYRVLADAGKESAADMRFRKFCGIVETGSIKNGGTKD
jgi:hypothetical protein